jgi:hypothetical protein
VTTYRVQYVVRPSPMGGPHVEPRECRELRLDAPDRARAFVLAWDHFVRQGFDVTVSGAGIRPLDFTTGEHMIVLDAGAKMVFGLPRNGVQIEGLVEATRVGAADGAD